MIAQNYTHATILDLNFLFSLLIGVVRIQQRFCDTVGWKGPWFVKGKLLNVWRTSPFLDVGVVLDQFRAHGVPMCLNKKVTILPGSDPESFFEINAFDDYDNPELRISMKALGIFKLIAQAFGLPGWLQINREEDGEFYIKLTEASQRAKEAQERRNKRTKALK